jgi:non-ribosomal peptide synthase protein (TIGR01720 family)
MEYLPLTLSQKWLLDELLKFRHPGWLTIEFLARTKEPMEEWAMQEAIYYLADRYESLRVRFTKGDEGWLQEVYPLSEADPFETYDLTDLCLPECKSRMKEVCCRERDRLLPEKGNLIRVLFFKFPEGEGRVWFCMHHIIADYISAVTLAREFMATYYHIRENRPLKWQTIKDYRRWLYMVEGYRRDILLPAEREYWESRPWERVRILPGDFPGKYESDAAIIDDVRNKRILSSYRAMLYQLDPEVTANLFNLFGAEFENALTAIFFLGVANCKKMDLMAIHVCNSGRNILPPDYGMEVHKLPGYISTARTLLLERPGNIDPMADFRDVLEQIKRVPNEGLGFYLIRDYLRNEDLRNSYFNFLQEGDVFLNYFGRIDSMVENQQYEVVAEDTGISGHVPELHNYLLQCLVAIRENQLFLKLVYSDVYLEAETIGMIAAEMKRVVGNILHENKKKNYEDPVDIFK